MELYSVTLYYLVSVIFLFLIAFFIRRKKERFVFFITCFFFLTLKFVFIIINENLGLFDTKLAGHATLVIHEKFSQRGIEIFLNGKREIFFSFVPQFLLNYVQLEFFGANRYTLIFTNALLTTFAGIGAYLGFRKIFGFRIAFSALFFLNLYPAAINFSIFGLRDPIIYFALAINIVAFIRLMYGDWLKAPFFILITSIILFYSRPELVAFIFNPYFLLILINLLLFYKKIRSLSVKIFVTILIVVFFLLPILGSLYVGYRFVVSNIGDVVSPTEILEIKAQSRYDRPSGSGMSGSNILPPNIYNILPWYARWIVQTIGIIIIPFPWLVTSISKVLAFGDSIFIMSFMALFIKFHKRFKSLLNLNLIIFWFTFLISIVIMGMIIINAGNAFRMRLAIAPYLIIPVAIYIGMYFEQRKFKTAPYES